MGQVTFLNDVESTLDNDSLIAGYKTPASKAGEKQSLQISSFLGKKIKQLDLIAASDAVRLNKLIHNIRITIKTSKGAAVDLRLSESLQERYFGVLVGSKFSLDSDLFSHTRICAEKGESVAQCRDRLMKFVKGVCKSHLRVLIISHPFACQVMTNVILGKKHTVLTSFWFKKGSCMSYNTKEGKFGITWKPENAYNAVSDTVYTVEKIYSKLLGADGPQPSPSAV